MDLKPGNKPWWGYLEEDLQGLITEALLLIDIFRARSGLDSDGNPEFHDYAFVVFPAAKAYEGFLKKLFLDLGLITKEDYFGKRFRIGKALNPYLDKEDRNESVYDKLVRYCGGLPAGRQGKDLADTLWETWRVCRNLTFHWFPKEKNSISFTEAKERVFLVIDSMEKALKECKIKFDKQTK